MINKQKKKECWTSLAFQWFRLYAPTAESIGSIPSQGTKILHATWCRQKKRKRNINLTSYHQKQGLLTSCVFFQTFYMIIWL